MNMRKGFTLVELLIVIVIIGILAAAMLLSTGSATAAARASTIISDMRGLKSAVLMFYADSMDAGLDTMASAISGNIGILAKYIDNADKFKSNGDPAEIIPDAATGKWWIKYKVEGDKEVQEKLAAKAEADGIYGDADTGTPFTAGTSSTFAYMIAR